MESLETELGVIVCGRLDDISHKMSGWLAGPDDEYNPHCATHQSGPALKALIHHITGPVPGHSNTLTEISCNVPARDFYQIRNQISPCSAISTSDCSDDIHPCECSARYVTLTWNENKN